MTFPWLRRKAEKNREDIVVGVKPAWPSVEDRLAQIARTQSELNTQAAEIKLLTSSIVKTLSLPNETAKALKELTPVLREIPPLMQGLPDALKSIDSQVVAMGTGQNQIRQEIVRLQILLSEVSNQILEMRR